MAFRIHLILLASLALASGCDRNQSAIRTYIAPKDVPPPQVASDQPSPADSQTADAPIRWTVPASWHSVRPQNELQYAAFQISADDPAALVTVVPLNSADLLPNVQRWAGQLNLPQVSETDLPRYATKTQVSGEQGWLVDMSGLAKGDVPQKRLLAAIIPHDGAAWSITLKGPPALIAAAKSQFDQFVHSIQFPTEPDHSSQADSPQPHNPNGQPLVSYKLVKWQAPAGWQEQPGANSMRVTSFRIGSGDEQAEAIVSRIQQGHFGSMLDNINRWRGQVGLEPLAQEQLGDLQPGHVAGHPALSLSYLGAGDHPQEILVSIDIEGSDVWFVKLLGPQGVVDAQKAAFQQFLDSMQFEPEPSH